MLPLPPSLYIFWLSFVPRSSLWSQVFWILKKSRESSLGGLERKQMGGLTHLPSGESPRTDKIKPAPVITLLQHLWISLLCLLGHIQPAQRFPRLRKQPWWLNNTGPQHSLLTANHSFKSSPSGRITAILKFPLPNVASAYRLSWLRVGG